MGLMNGVQQWIFQRISNVVFVIFGLILLNTIMSSGLTYEALNELFATTSFKVYAFITLAFASANSILAGWQITGDYAAKFNIPPTLMMLVTIVVSLAYFIYGSMLLFG